MKVQSSRVDRFFQRTAQFVSEILQDQVESWSAAHSVEPAEGPGRDEYRLKKMLKQNQRSFGKDSVYLVSNHASLAQHYRQQLQGMAAAEHYQKALELFEKELQERGEVASLHRLIPAGLGQGQDAASLYEQAADFFQLYGGPPRSIPLLERAQQLVVDSPFPRRAEIERRLARLHLDSGDRAQAQKLYSKVWNEALQHYPANSPELGLHAEELARSLEPGPDCDELWGLSLTLQAQPASAPSLSALSKQYARLGHTEQARVLRERAEMLQLESSVRTAVPSRALKQDLERLIVLYESQGEAGSAERARLRLTQVETRLALKGPLHW
ncbi:MAG: hypothetical protein U0931_10395 [Vulcanimicrobiota bacterium]